MIALDKNFGLMCDPPIRLRYHRSLEKSVLRHQLEIGEREE